MIETAESFEAARKFYEKKHARELAAVLNNLRRYLAQLNYAKNSRCVHAGFMHNEHKGVIAIDESAGGPSLQATRLYTFADDKTKTLHLITIGNKTEQQSDIQRSHLFVAKNFPTP